MQIANDLRTRIGDGTLREGARPSITYEGEAWGVARQTVAKALWLLEQEGLLKRYPGVGYVVLPLRNPKRKARPDAPS